MAAFEAMIASWWWLAVMGTVVDVCKEVVVANFFKTFDGEIDEVLSSICVE